MRIVLVLALACACAPGVYAKTPAGSPTQVVRPAPPDHVDEADYQRMQAAYANAKAAQSALEAARLTVRLNEIDSANANAKAQALLDKLRDRYRITERDHVDDGDGHAITRAK